MATAIFLFLSFPIACALIGYVTNVVAIRMIFRPYRPVHVGPLRFVGVMPKHLPYFARQLAGIVAREFMRTSDMVRAIDWQAAARRLRPVFEQHLARLLEDLNEAAPPALAQWLTPEAAQWAADRIAQAVRERGPTFARDLAERADEVLDVRDVITRRFLELGPARVEAILYEISGRELRFIENYGAVFGALFGFGQFFLVQVADVRWTLPVIGFVVGAVTNWLAVQMLFYPRQPRRIPPGFRWQGLFPRRQREIARQLGEVAAREFLAPDRIFAELLDRALPDRLDAEGKGSLEEAAAKLAEWVPELRWLLDSLGDLPDDVRERFARIVARHYDALRSTLIEAVAAEAKRQIDIRGLLSARVANLRHTEFEELLRGLFKQEEFYLIVYGAMLGAAMGAVQLALLLLAR